MAQTWHHGLMARWWAELNQGGDDIEFFLNIARREGGAVLDAGCGTGRILLPLAGAGIEVDGSDASADMLSYCRSALQAEQLDRPQLLNQAMHELTPERCYQTVVVCGAFGVGSTRDEDLAGLRRIHRALVPGGLLVMDHHLPQLESPQTWGLWCEKPELPLPWPARGMRRDLADGTQLELLTRMLDINPLEQTLQMQMRLIHREGDDVIAEDEYAIDLGLYFKREIDLMLATVGFVDIKIGVLDSARSPDPWDDARIVFTARVPG